MKWITENGEKLIDSEGKILNYKNKINNLETINLYGKAANINIKTLKEDFLDKNEKFLEGFINRQNEKINDKSDLFE